MALATLIGPAVLPAQELERVDRIVAVVDEDPIFYSDLVRAIAFGFAAAPAGPEDFRLILEKQIDQRLRAHEIDRYGVPPAPEANIAEQLGHLEAALGGGAALDAELQAAGSNREELRRSLDLQLRILSYIEERLAPRVFVDDVEVTAYYQGELQAELAGRGQPLPPLAEVKEGIKTVLRERKLNEEAAKWTADLRRRARLVDLLDRPASREEDLPPVVLRIESKR